MTTDNTVGTRNPRIPPASSPFHRKGGWGAEVTWAGIGKTSFRLGGSLPFARFTGQNCFLYIQNSEKSFSRYLDCLRWCKHITSSLPTGVVKQQRNSRPRLPWVEASGFPRLWKKWWMLCRRVFQPFVSYSETRRILPSIHGLGKVNQFIVVSSFTTETLFSIITALQPRDWITKIDLKDVCHHRLVYVNLWKLFRLVVAGIFYRFHVLSFGLSTTLREFTKMSHVVKPLRTQGVSVQYLLGRLNYACAFS